MLGVVIILSLKEPLRPNKALGSGHLQNGEGGVCHKLATILKPFLSPSLIMLCIAGSIRNAGKNKKI